MPRLTPRRSRHDIGGEENSLFKSELSFTSSHNDDNRFVSSIKGGEKPIIEPRPPPLQHYNPNLYQQRVLTDKQEAMDSSSNRNHPLSPCPTSTMMEQEIITMDGPAKSPRSNDVLSDTSFTSDCSITPPATGPRPLVVSAKRLGQDVRREHSKRRRPSRRVNKGDSQNGFCLWKDHSTSGASTQETAAAAYSSSDDEHEQDDLPFLFDDGTKVSETEQNKHYWEWCYGKEVTVDFFKAEKSFSAKRAPPKKGCLFYETDTSTPISSYKTPPTSPSKRRKGRSDRPKKNVQFGLPQAAEYDIDQPPGQLTPMPSHVTRERYSMDQKEQTQVEEEMTQETKQNSILLAEWEGDFEEPKSSSSRRRRKNRRSSSLFTPSPNFKSSDRGDERNHHQDLTFATNKSPSLEVAENLASLKMTSPESSVKPTATATAMTSQTGSLESQIMSSQPVELTAEFGVNLKEIHSTGGAMDITPPQRAPSQQHVISVDSSRQETTPPPSSVSLDAIHTVGGALDLESPASTDQTSTSPPLSMMNLCEKEGSDEITQASDGNLNHAAPVDIIKNLLINPLEDQEWNSSDVLLNFSKARGNSKGLESLLECIDSRQNGVLACMDDLMERAKYVLVSKPNITAKNEHDGHNCALKEWKELETKLIKDLNQVLGKVLGKAAALSQRSKILSLPKTTQAAKKICLSRSIERDIQALQEAISKEREQIKFLEAVNAPYSALHCQTAFGISGFRLDEYSGGGKLQVSFEHVVNGIESRFVFDLTNGEVTASCNNVASLHRQPIPVDHLAAKFHAYFLEQAINANIPILDGLILDDLHESILVLSRWLGNLDLAACAFYRAIKEANDKSLSIEVDMPVIQFKLHGGKSARLNFKDTQSFIPQGYLLYQVGETEVWKPFPSGVTCANYFQKVIQSLLQSTI